MRGRLSGFLSGESGVFYGIGLGYRLVRTDPGRWCVRAPDGRLVADDVEGLDRANQLATEHSQIRPAGS